MTVLPTALRDEIRQAIDARRRDEILRAGGYRAVEAAERHAARGPSPRTARAPERRTAPSRPSEPLDAAQPPWEVGRCVYCGAPARTVVCHAHEDLL